MNICGNFAKDGECGTCNHFVLCGICSGVCSFNNRWEDKMATDTCDCGEYEKEDK